MKLPVSVLDADDGKAAIEIIESTPVDLVFCDLNMPGLSGMELIKKLMLPSGKTRVPVVLVTLASDNAIRDQALAEGAAGFLNKPVKPVDVTTVATNILGVS